MHDGGIDPHAWLDPDNAILWTQEIARVLSELDPENTELYQMNAATALTELTTISDVIIANLIPLTNQNYAVGHDAYQYFETRFGLRPQLAITLGDGSRPSLRELARIREKLENNKITCVFDRSKYTGSAVGLACRDSGYQICSG